MDARVAACHVLCSCFVSSVLCRTRAMPALDGFFADSACDLTRSSDPLQSVTISGRSRHLSSQTSNFRRLRRQGDTPEPYYLAVLTRSPCGNYGWQLLYCQQEICHISGIHFVTLGKMIVT